eukprot:4379746-Prymnesium_polylepis.1
MVARVGAAARRRRWRELQPLDERAPLRAALVTFEGACDVKAGGVPRRLGARVCQQRRFGTSHRSTSDARMQ